MIKRPTSEEVAEAVSSNLSWVGEIVTVVTLPDSATCKVCKRYAGDYEELTNHYLQTHGYRLLSVGPVVEETIDGDVEPRMMSVLGKERDA